MSYVIRPNNIPGLSARSKHGIGDARGISSGTRIPAQGHLLDANTVALWRFDETSSLMDSVDAKGNYLLHQYLGPSVIVGQIGKARSLKGYGQGYLQATGDAALGTVFNGDWTVEQWARSSDNTNGYMFLYHGLAAPLPYDPAGSGNDLPMVDVSIAAQSIWVRVWHDRYTFDQILLGYATFPSGIWHHWAVTRRSLGSNNYEFKLYQDGVIRATMTYAGFTVALTGASHFLGIGNMVGFGGLGTLRSGTNLVQADIDDTRVSNICRTATEIQASYLRGQGDP